MNALRIHPDNEELSPHFKIFSLTTSSKSFFANNTVPGFRMWISVGGHYSAHQRWITGYPFFSQRHDTEFLLAFFPHSFYT